MREVPSNSSFVNILKKTMLPIHKQEKPRGEAPMIPNHVFSLVAFHLCYRLSQCFTFTVYFALSPVSWALQGEMLASTDDLSQFLHRSSGLIPPRACSICSPQPTQLGFPHVLQLTLLHMVMFVNVSVKKKRS